MRGNQVREKSRTFVCYCGVVFQCRVYKFSKYLVGGRRCEKLKHKVPFDFAQGRLCTPLRSARGQTYAANLWDITLARTDADNVQADVAFFSRSMNSTNSVAGFSATG